MDLYLNKFMPMQIYHLINEAIQGSLQNASLQTQFDGLSVINQRARVLFMQCASVDLSASTKKVEGSLFMTEQLDPIRNDLSMLEIKNKLAEEKSQNEEKYREKEERKKLKKSNEQEFENMLYSNENLYKLSNDMWK